MTAEKSAPPGPAIAALLEDARRRAVRYLDGLQDRKVAPSAAAVERLAVLEQPLPAGPTDPAEVLAVLDDIVSPATMAMAGPRFFGFVIGGSLPATLAANWLAAAWDQNTAFANVTPGAAMLEEISLRWLVEFLGLPAATQGAFVTGATVANFTALAAARCEVLARAGWNVEADGLFGAPPVTVVVGEEAHPTLIKSLGLLGLGRNRVVRVPVDGQGRMSARDFPTLSGPAIVCMQAGNINTGSFDPFADIIPRAHEAGAWVHVDGAFGLWAAGVPSLQHLAHGMSDADSWATDAHKWLNVPYDSGLAFVRVTGALPRAMAITAEYLPSGESRRNPADYTPELSRRARGVEVWAALRSLGRSGLVEMFERNCRQAQRFGAALTAAGYEVLNEVVLNQVIVSFGTPEVTGKVIEALQEDGTCWCGVSHWHGRTVMRISVCSWATTDEDVERSIDAMLRVAREVTR
ncbi:MAG TPA: pyridoxal-dependent decarboxylase [Steroidobacteraceae bacterium]|nr:pyridoxal-dependent decarboxylase [Steroidobacteraceae bacterium]